MTQQSSNATVTLYPNKNPKLRLFALWYFATLMTLWNIAGHTFLGFEQSWAHPVVAVLSACLTQWLLEWIDAAAANRMPRFAGGLANFLNFFPPAIISGFACAMLLYPNNRLMPIVFASVLSICSKSLIRVRMSNGARTHVFNPSNFGIIATLLIFPWVGQAPPYQFTENITGFWHWALPGAILVTGIIVHGFATGRLPLCIAWLVAFVLQGVIRAWLAGNDWFVPLMPMSSAAFILFTLYMIPDPATTPVATGRQVLHTKCSLRHSLCIDRQWLRVKLSVLPESTEVGHVIVSLSTGHHFRGHQPCRQCLLLKHCALAKRMPE